MHILTLTVSVELCREEDCPYTIHPEINFRKVDANSLQQGVCVRGYWEENTVTAKYVILSWTIIYLAIALTKVWRAPYVTQC